MSDASMIAAEKILKSFKVLPTVPAAASKAVQLLNEPDVDLEKVADIILADQVITARVIRIINSPLYMLLQEVDSIRKALIYLGPQKIFEIIITSCFLELTDRQNSSINLDCCWEHSFGVALISKFLAENSGQIKPEKAYVAGIVHDIGEIVLSQQRNEEFLSVLQLSASKQIDLHEAELEIFGASHSEVGALLARQWRFPEEIADVILHHHDAVTPEMPVLVRIVSVADRICLDVNLSCRKDGERYRLGGDDPASNLETLADQLQLIGIGDIDKFKVAVEGMVEQARQAVKSIYS